MGVKTKIAKIKLANFPDKLKCLNLLLAKINVSCVCKTMHAFISIEKVHVKVYPATFHHSVIRGRMSKV